MSKNIPVSKACEVVGGLSALARVLGVKPPTVSQWASGSRPVPDRYALAIEDATHGAVTRKDLCPNTWRFYWPELKESDTKTPTDE